MHTGLEISAQVLVEGDFESSPAGGRQLAASGGGYGEKYGVCDGGDCTGVTKGKGRAFKETEI